MRINVFEQPAYPIHGYFHVRNMLNAYIIIGIGYIAVISMENLETILMRKRQMIKVCVFAVLPSIMLTWCSLSLFVREEATVEKRERERGKITGAEVAFLL